MVEIPDPLAAMTLENSVRLPALSGNDMALAAPIIAGEVAGQRNGAAALAHDPPANRDGTGQRRFVDLTSLGR